MPIIFHFCPSEGGVRATRISPIHWSCSTGTCIMTIAWAPSVWVEPGLSAFQTLRININVLSETLVQRLWVFDTHAERGSDPGWCRSDTCSMHVTGERRENTICIRSQAMKFYNGSSLSSITLSQKPQWDNKDGTLELTSRNCSAIHSRGSCVAW